MSSASTTGYGRLHPDQSAATSVNPVSGDGESEDILSNKATSEQTKQSKFLKPIGDAALRSLKQETATALLSVTGLDQADRQRVSRFAESIAHNDWNSTWRTPKWVHYWNENSAADLNNIRTAFVNRAVDLNTAGRKDESHTALVAAKRISTLGCDLVTCYRVLGKSKQDIAEELGERIKEDGGSVSIVVDRGRSYANYIDLYTRQWTEPSENDQEAKDKETGTMALLGLMRAREEQDELDKATARSEPNTEYSKGDSKV